MRPHALGGWLESPAEVGEQAYLYKVLRWALMESLEGEPGFASGELREANRSRSDASDNLVVWKVRRGNPTEVSPYVTVSHRMIWPESRLRGLATECFEDQGWM
jgi:hypothetical protein